MATKLPSGNYRTLVKISDNPRKFKSFTADTARKADMLAEQWKLTHLPNVKKGSFGKATEEFIYAMQNTLSVSTLRSYDSIRRMIRDRFPAFYGKNLAEICTEDFYPMYKTLKSPKTVRNWNGFVSSVYAYKDINMPRLRLPEKKKVTYHIPDENEIRAITDVVKGTNLEIPVALGIRGMRRGEIAAVKAEDIEGNVLHIQRGLVYTGSGYIEKGTKTTDSDRYIILPKEIAGKIKKAGRATEMTPQAISCAYTRMLRRNGFEKSRFHDLRHAFVSIAMANKIPANYVMAMGGWKTDRVMKSCYLQQLPEHAKKYSKEMEKIISGI